MTTGYGDGDGRPYISGDDGDPTGAGATE